MRFCFLGKLMLPYTKSSHALHNKQKSLNALNKAKRGHNAEFSQTSVLRNFYDSVDVDNMHDYH